MFLFDLISINSFVKCKKKIRTIYLTYGAYVTLITYKEFTSNITNKTYSTRLVDALACKSSIEYSS